MCVDCESKGNSDIDHLLKVNNQVSEKGLLNNQVAVPLTRHLSLGWEIRPTLLKYELVPLTRHMSLGWEIHPTLLKYEFSDEWYELEKLDESFIQESKHAIKLGVVHILVYFLSLAKFIS